MRSVSLKRGAFFTRHFKYLLDLRFQPQRSRRMHLFKDENLILPYPGKHKQDIALAWVYPNSYSIGMSGLGYQLIWWLLEQEPDVKVRRTFTDQQEPNWQQSDLIGFTLSWELDYANIIQLLRQASIPALASERDDDTPIVFGGGPVLTANPEPFAEFFDVILLGDAEVTIPNLVSAWRTARSLATRTERLRHLSNVDGLYVPSCYRYVLEDERGPLTRIEPAFDNVPEYPRKQAFNAPEHYAAHSVILSPEGGWGDKFLLELVRSCPQECRFCLASFLTRPFRFPSVDTALAKIELALKHTSRVGLLGPSVTEHPQFSELAAALLTKTDLEISIASIRMDTIDPLILKMLVALKQRSVTIALESGSERLRTIMKKNLTEAEIWQGMDIIAASGIEQVKFYGIVGLPGEIEDDLAETVRLLTAIKKKYKQLRIVFGVSSFVPKAQTPFQWSARDQDCARKLEFARKNLAKIGIDVRAESHNWSDVQTYLSRSDRRVTPKLLEIAESSGKLGSWKKLFRSEPEFCPSSEFYVFRNIPQDEFLPWSHLLDAPRKAILDRHRQAADSLIV